METQRVDLRGGAPPVGDAFAVATAPEERLPNVCDAAEHRTARPWYTSKTDPAFSDMLAKLRRVISAARFMPAAAGQPTDAEIRAVQRAWAQAGLDNAA
jgi:hypothetical protein